MDIVKRNTRASKLTRITVWTTLAFLAFWTANVVNTPKKRKEEETKLFTVRNDIQKIWMLVTNRVDETNRRATDYIRANQLKPGDPLPPRIFFIEDDPLWGYFTKDAPMQITNTFELNTKKLKFLAWSMMGIQATVPKEGEPYSVVLLIADPKLLKAGVKFYPSEPNTIQKVREALADLDRKQKKTGEVN